MADLLLPETRYAFSGDVNIAYQAMGTGPVDIIVVPGLASHVEFMHEMPGYTAFHRRLSTFARVVTFDKRGQGLSDRISGAPSLEQRIDDVRAIMDTIGSKRATLLGHSEGCPMSVLFAATYPERVSHLILFGGYAVAAMLSNDIEGRIAERLKFWGTGEMLKTLSPSQATDQNAIRRFAKYQRLAASPGAIKAISLLNAQIDVRAILPNVQAPTLCFIAKAMLRSPSSLVAT
jgi:pimeloyl-ACP methyl ester carboxylesterase